MIRPDAIEAYKKGQKIITSCENLDHFSGAKKYIKNFDRIFAPTELTKGLVSLYNIYRKKHGIS